MSDQKTQPPPAWQSKMCPELTKALAKPAASPLQLAGAVQPAAAFEPRACVGPACMWFLPTVNEKGEFTGQGDCAVTCGPVASNQAAMASAAAANALAQLTTIVAGLVDKMATKH